MDKCIHFHKDGLLNVYSLHFILIGFGAMILQFAAHVALIKLTKWIVTQVVEIVTNKPPPKVQEFYNLETSTNVVSSMPGSNTISRSISSLSVE